VSCVLLCIAESAHSFIIGSAYNRGGCAVGSVASANNRGVYCVLLKVHTAACFVFVLLEVHTTGGVLLEITPRTVRAFQTNIHCREAQSPQVTEHARPVPAPMCMWVYGNVHGVAGSHRGEGALGGRSALNYAAAWCGACIAKSRAETATRVASAWGMADGRWWRFLHRAIPRSFTAADVHWSAPGSLYFALWQLHVCIVAWGSAVS